MDFEIFLIHFKELIVCNFLPYISNVPFSVLFIELSPDHFSPFSRDDIFSVSQKIGHSSFNFDTYKTLKNRRQKTSTDYKKLFANCKSSAFSYFSFHVNLKAKKYSTPKILTMLCCICFLFVILTLYTLYLHMLILGYNFNDFL